MSDFPDQGRSAAPLPTTPARPLDDQLTFDSPQAGKKALREDFNYWTGHITQSSVQLSFGVIAANWAAFQSVSGVLVNGWAKFSLFAALLSLAANLLGPRYLAKQLSQQFDYAQANPAKWADEYAAARAKDSQWPYTEQIHRTSWLLREARVWLPVVAGGLFVVAVIVG